MKKLLLILMMLCLRQPIQAACLGSVVNPLTDICWTCFFPITIGGIDTSVGPTCDLAIAGNYPVCYCPLPPPLFERTGVGMSFWEPARMIETVKEAYCFPSFATQTSTDVNNGHGASEDEADFSTFFHAHYLIFPAYMLLEKVVSAQCLTNESMDVGYITEVDPLWNDDELSAMIHPEAVLFANPLAQMACIADAVASNVFCSIDYMPWCMGAWGSVYPLTGHTSDTNYLQASSGIAARMLYKLSRQMLLLDYGKNVCGAEISPIWTKTNYRLQMMKPVRDFTCHPIGRAETIWGWGKAVPDTMDNPIWLIWRHRGCCAS